MNREMIAPILTNKIKELPYVIKSMATMWAQKDLYRPFGLDDYLLMQCVSGYGIVNHKGEEIKIKPNDIIIWAPNEAQFYRNNSQEDWIVNWIGFSSHRLPMVLKDGFFYSELFPLSLGSTKLHTIKQLLLDETVASQLRGASVLYELLSEISIYDAQLDNNDKTFDLKRVTGYMKQHTDRQLSLEKLSIIFNISESYICKLFNRYYKTTPIQYFIQLKMSKAKVLLVVNPDEKINKIGELCGYSDQVYFSRVFKKYVGQTPSQFRKLNM